ncbi:PREDICTED: uncharacterized protein LOC109584134 [Amphimedon queenslandica]|uniref:Uncharacterized protein n=1 Tax=Amphimedon queenslandica TaxID=400682 RepID=A0AAN0JE67_AMPQE|nr:PREDICTED: uncharacterized protein LOC109584134 [Amphimedon queenslandica]|eukprot:XP_019855300.1 PREDICTED: uncharacterized protein LOC109584134 [Amphimedon queenslandica]
MSKRQITSILSKAQLGSSLDTLTVLGSHKGDVILLANNSSLIHLTLHSSSSHQQSLVFSLVFSIEPNMESFQYDDTLPQYVGKLNDVLFNWLLLFTLSEDGIVLVYSVSNAMIIAAIHPLEYCRMFSSNTPDGPSLLQTLSLSSFHKILVSPDLMKLCVSTKTHHIIAVDLGIYFAMFSSHYSKNFRQKLTKRTPPTQRPQDPHISQEEELERGRYGGLTRREKGTKYVRPFVSHFFVAKRCSRLMRNIDRMNLNEGYGLSLVGVSKLPKEHDKPVRPVSGDKWYMPSRGAWLGK